MNAALLQYRTCVADARYEAGPLATMRSEPPTGSETRRLKPPPSAHPTPTAAAMYPAEQPRRVIRGEATGPVQARVACSRSLPPTNAYPV